MSFGTHQDLGQTVSRETMQRLDLLDSLVRKWNPVINLVSKESLSLLRTRHIEDSMQVFGVVNAHGKIWSDLGSGGGFPGLVIAILASELSETTSVNLVESDTRKATFLREAVRQLGVRATVINARIERLAPLESGIVSARALGSLKTLCAFASRHLGDDGVALFPKGVNHRSEIIEAQMNWSFDLVIHPSKTEPGAALLELRNIQNV